MRTIHRQRPSLTGPLARLGGAAILLVVIIVVIVLLVSGGGGSSGGPPRQFESMFQDDALLVYAPSTAQLAQTLTTLKALGVDRVRITVKWSDIAPEKTSRTRPAGFKADDPASYPQTADSGWAYYDRIDLLAHQKGIAVDFDVTAPAPLWATPKGSPSSHYDAVYAPSAKDFQAFMTAVGTRYDGRYKIAFLPGQPKLTLPRVNFWTVWNEPNQPGWLAPQFTVHGRRHTMVAPGLYREYLDAAWAALQATGHGQDQILVGETAPEGCTLDGKVGCGIYPAALQPIPPIPFVQSLYCVDAGYRPLRGAAARAAGCPASGGRQDFVKANPALFQANAFTHHPYSFDTRPTAPLPEPSFVPLANLNRLQTALDRAFAAYGSDRRIPLYLDEYGYDSDPPNPIHGVSLSDQAAYLDEAAYMAWHDPRVQGLSQFELVDSAPGPHGYSGTFQTGLEFITGKRKPAFDAYRLPIVVLPGHSSGGGVRIWGMVRPARNGSSPHVAIECGTRNGHYALLCGTATVTSPDGTFEATVKPQQGLRSVAISWKAPGGSNETSRAAPVAGSGLR